MVCLDIACVFIMRGYMDNLCSSLLEELEQRGLREIDIYGLRIGDMVPCWPTALHGLCVLVLF